MSTQRDKFRIGGIAGVEAAHELHTLTEREASSNCGRLRCTSRSSRAFIGNCVCTLVTCVLIDVWPPLTLSANDSRGASPHDSLQDLESVSGARTADLQIPQTYLTLPSSSGRWRIQ